MLTFLKAIRIPHLHLKACLKRPIGRKTSGFHTVRLTKDSFTTENRDLQVQDVIIPVLKRGGANAFGMMLTSSGH